MTQKAKKRYVQLFVGVAFLALLLSLAADFAPRLLVLDNTEISDYIVVLDGHDASYYTGLELLQQGYGRQMFVCLDLPDVVLDGRERALDRQFVEKTAGALATRIELCTNGSDEDLSTVLRARSFLYRAHKIVLVAPESVSRAQLIRLRKQLPEYHWTVKPVSDENFNQCWWRRRRWIKTLLKSLAELQEAASTRPSKPPSSH